MSPKNSELNHFSPNFTKNLSPSSLNPQELMMATPIALNVLPISAPHRDLDHLPLVDKYFQIKDTSIQESPLKLYYRYKEHYLNHADKIGLWESGLPKYKFPRVHIFPKIIHYFHMNYHPSQRAVMTPDHSVLFTITIESINEMS